jgi:hypothetical protein
MTDLAEFWAVERTPRAHPEADLDLAVRRYLPLALPGCVVNHSPGEGLRSKQARIALSRSGYCAGWPDLEVFWRSRVFLIELKSARGVLSDAQRETHRRLEYQGFPVLMCRTPEGVECALRELGVPLKASVAA